MSEKSKEKFQVYRRKKLWKLDTIRQSIEDQSMNSGKIGSILRSGGAHVASGLTRLESGKIRGEAQRVCERQNKRKSG